MMKNTIKFSTRSILPMLALTGLMSGVIGLNFNNTATAQTTAPSQSLTVLPKSRHSSASPRRIFRRVLRNASRRLGVPKRRLRYKVTPKTFGNPCIFEFGQICTREYNPIHGWVVKVRSKNKSIIYHVAKDGRYIADPKAK
ncbi:MAG: hypothetical protein QNJ36_12550 [Calothrix sp. MO_167.B42]|nr:hypothetical protein [Calothrix sp. MO_167.B42]